MIKADKEKLELKNEEKKIAELEKIIQLLKENQVSRNQNITNYQEQLKQIQSEIENWKNKSEQVVKLKQQNDVKIKTLSKQESDWKSKQKQYQTEVSKWQKETIKQQKIYDTYNSLAESKE